MVSCAIVVKSPAGIQIDTAGILCEKAMEFDSNIHLLYRGENQANAKSVLSILGAGIRRGETIEIICEGNDEKEAAEALSALML